MIDTAYTGYTDIPAVKVQETAVYSKKDAAQTSFQTLLNEKINESSVSAGIVPEAAPKVETLLTEIQSLAESLLEQIQTDDEEAYAEVIKRLLKLIDEITGDDVDYRSAMIMMADMLASSAGLDINNQSKAENEAIPDISAVMASAQNNRVSVQIGDDGTRPDIHLQEQNPSKTETGTADEAGATEEIGTAEKTKTANVTGTEEETAYITQAYTAIQQETNIYDDSTENSTTVKPVAIEDTATVWNNRQAPQETKTETDTQQQDIRKNPNETDIGQIAQTYNGEAKPAENTLQVPLNVSVNEVIEAQTEDPDILGELFLSSSANSDKSAKIDETAKELFDGLLKIAKEKSTLSQTETDGEDLFALSYPHELTAVRNTGRNPQNLSNLKNKPDEFTQLLQAVKGKTGEDAEGAQKTHDGTEKTANVPIQLQKDISLFENNLNAVLGKSAEEVHKPVASQLADVIGAKISTLGNGETEFEMTLAPESLGKISIRLVTENGRVSVAVTAERRETGELLQNRAENLAQNLRQNGVELERYTVYQEQGQEAYYNQDGKSGNREQRNERETSENESEADGEDGLDFAELISAI